MQPAAWPPPSWTAGFFLLFAATISSFSPRLAIARPNTKGSVRAVPDDLSSLDGAELERRIASIRERMRPVEQELTALRVEQDVLLTEVRRRERNAHRTSRADLKAAMKEGTFPTMAELIAGSDSGSLDDFVFNLKTGGEVRLGFPGARTQTMAFTDGAKIAQASDLARAAELYAAGWELGSPGRPGVRVHFPGTRQERLVPAPDVFARPRDPSQG